jgi:hypothetical protein
MRLAKGVAIGAVVAVLLVTGISLAVPNGGSGSSNGETMFGDFHFYGNAEVHENTDAFVIPAADEWNLIYDDAWVTGALLNGITVDTANTGAITAFADQGAGLVRVTSVAHGLEVNDAVSISGTTSYNDVFQIIAVATDDVFDITDTWVANDATGIFNHSAGLVATYPGRYFVGYTISLKPGAINDEYAVRLYNGFTAGLSDHITATEQHITLQQTSKFDSIAGFGFVDMLAGESVHLGIKNIGNDANPTPRYIHIFIKQN